MLAILKSKKSEGPQPELDADQPAEAQLPQSLKLEQSITPQEREEIMRSPGFRGELSYTLIHRIWTVFLLTLAVDIWLLSQDRIVLPPAPLTLSMDATVLILLVVALLGMDRNNGLLLVRRFRDIQGKVSESRYMSYALIGVFVLFTFGEVLFKLGQANWLSLIVVAVFLLLGTRRFLGSIAEKQAEFVAMQRDRFAFTIRANQQLFFAQLVPLVCARLISLAGLLRVQQALPGSDGSTYILLSALLLFTLAPSPEDFTARCKRCARPVSRALSDLLFCQNCDAAAFTPAEDTEPEQK